MNVVNRKIYIIAEAGVNHNGSLVLAKKLVDAAANSGADAVKFQSFIAKDEISLYAAKAQYQIRSTESDESQLDMVRKLELSWNEQEELNHYCKEKNIDFLSTPFEMKSLLFLARKLNLEYIKFSSGDITTAPLLLEAARLQKKVILSTGMATLGEIEDALGVLAFGYCGTAGVPSIKGFREAYTSFQGQEHLRQKVTLLHCTTEYPAPYKEVNLNALFTMRQAFQLPVGLSDHTKGIAISVAAAALGAEVIEKHFTLSRSMSGPDHQASLEPKELQDMVNGIRQVELAMGCGIKMPTSSEHSNCLVARKSLVALQDISAGALFTSTNLGYKRPGGGISPLFYWDFLKRRAKRKYIADEVVDDVD